jgi:1-acyl-sn-glycerol-3-phosphate acyltransferase
MLSPQESHAADRYIKGLPGPLKDRPLNKAFRRGYLEVITRLFPFESEGMEHVPEPPYLVASNHSGYEVRPLLAAFRADDLHPIAAQHLVYERSRMSRLFCDMIGAIPIAESFGNLNEGQRQALLSRMTNEAEKGRYLKAMASDNVRHQIRGLRDVIGVLLKNDPVLLFPEGPWLHEGATLRKAYGGIETIAKGYEKVSGKPLPIVPVGTDTAVHPIRIKIGAPLTRATHREERNDAEPFQEYVMKRIADLLPEEMRGMYGEAQTRENAEH